MRSVPPPIETTLTAAMRSFSMFNTFHLRVAALAAIMASVFLLTGDRKSTRLNSSHFQVSRMPSSA